MDKYTLRAFAQHYAKIGDMEKLKQILERCEKELAEDLSWIVLMAINSIAVDGKSDDRIEPLLEKLPSSYNLWKSIKHGIHEFVKSGNGAIVPKILETSKNHIDLPEMAQYLINELVLQKIDSNQVNDVWDNLTAIGITVDKYVDVYHSAYSCRSTKLIEEVLQCMHSNGLEMTDKVFKQLVSIAGEQDTEHMFTTLSRINVQYDFTPSTAFIVNVILPKTDWKSYPSQTIARLRTALPSQTNYKFSLPLIKAALNENNIRIAYEIAEKEFVFLELFETPLVQAYLCTGDTEYFVRFIRLIYDRLFRDNLEKSDMLERQDAFIQNIIQLVIIDDRTSEELNGNFLSALFEAGFFITDSFADLMIRELNADGNIKHLLNKLGKQRAHLQSALQVFPGDYHTMSSDEIINILKIQRLYRQRSFRCQKNLLHAYIRERNSAHLEQYMDENPDVHLHAADYAQIIELYVKQKNLTKAIEWLNAAIAETDRFFLNNTITMNFVDLLTAHVRSGKNVDLCYVKSDDNTEQQRFVFESLFDEYINRRKDSLALNKAFDLFGGIITVHLEQSEPLMAIMAFEQMVRLYELQTIPNWFLITFMKIDRDDILQRVENVLTDCLGEDHSQTLLAVAYIESNRPQQANHSLEFLSSDSVAALIKRKCAFYLKWNRVDFAECLLNATKGLPCDRSIIYETLLDIYAKKNLVGKALELHENYSLESGMVPTKKFLNTFEMLIKRNSSSTHCTQP